MAKQNRNFYNKTYKIIPDKSDIVETAPSTSKPMHVKRVEAALSLDKFLKYVDNQYLESSDSDSNDSAIKNDLENFMKDLEAYNFKDYFNFSHVSNNRKWLAEILQENVDVQEETNWKDLVKSHLHHKSVVKKTSENVNNYSYFGAGLLSNVDKYPEIEKTVPVKSLKRKAPKDEQPTFSSEIVDDISNEPILDISFDNGLEFQNVDEEDSNNVHSDFSNTVQVATSSSHANKKRAKKFKDEESKKKWEDMMTIKRRKVFTNLVKKEIGKQHRSKMNRHKEMLLQCKRVAQQCLKHGRQKAVWRYSFSYFDKLKNIKTYIRKPPPNL